MKLTAALPALALAATAALAGCGTSGAGGPGAGDGDRPTVVTAAYPWTCSSAPSAVST
ncbi:hypothetical protein [Barrientosiimonas endolithica]|uniref:hypothetical protein n=1 Tax=Barrientosiimonas endolithica TaxID=1535208 RepID=UPI00259B25A2|nr:hypothetical protein [Barrientosiimonas endolithica]